MEQGYTLIRLRLHLLMHVRVWCSWRWAWSVSCHPAIIIYLRWARSIAWRHALRLDTPSCRHILRECVSRHRILRLGLARRARNLLRMRHTKRRLGNARGATDERLP